MMQQIMTQAWIMAVTLIPVVAVEDEMVAEAEEGAVAVAVDEATDFLLQVMIVAVVAVTVNNTVHIKY